MHETEHKLLQLEGLVYPEVLSEESQKAALSVAPAQAEAEVNRVIADLAKLLGEMDALIPLERDPVRREVARKRREHSEQRLEDLRKKGLARRSAALRKLMDERSRAALFSQAHPQHLTSHLDELKDFQQESEALRQSHRGVDDILSVGQAVISSLSAQGETIRRATDKVEGVVGSLGISNSLLRAVRRRQWGDAAIVYGGMVVVTLVLYLFYRWVHSTPSLAQPAVVSTPPPSLSTSHTASSWSARRRTLQI